MRWGNPWVAISGAITRAVDPAAPDIMARRPPVMAIVVAMVKQAKSPTCGSTPATTENASASGMSANAVTSPASISMSKSLGCLRTVSVTPRCVGLSAGWAVVCMLSFAGCVVTEYLNKPSRVMCWCLMWGV